MQAWIVSSRSGELGHWTTEYEKVKTRIDSVVLERGDTIDFIVDPRGNVDCDTFNWAPVLRLTSPAVKAPAGGQQVSPSNFSRVVPLLWSSDFGEQFTTGS